MAILLDNRKHNGVIPMQRRNSRSLGRSNSCNRKQNVHNSALKYESSDSANQPEVQSINSSRNGIGEGEEGTTKGRGKAISRAKCRKGSYSLGRNGSGKSNPMSSAAEGAQLVVMDSAERHCNEKILASGTIIRLPSRSSFYKMFELGSQIGQGNFSDVFLVYNSESGAKFAVKEIDKARLHGKLHFVANEIALLQRSQHKNICRLVEAYECQSLYFLMFEYAQKGDLFETIKRVGRLGEQSTAQIARQAASALAFLHRRQIVHRDLKPENILLCADSTIKLTDFGLACIVLGPLYRVCGTPTYVAPEVLTQQGYGVQVDVWSLGVILYICLAGFAPFRCTDRIQLFNQIVRARPTFEQSCWSRITFKAKQLLMAMLVGNPETRLTADQLLADEWIFSARWAWESNEN